MKKGSILLVTLLLAAIVSVKAQVYEKGTNVVSAGVGLGSSIVSSYGSQTPGISLQYERGVAEAGPGVISVGGYLGFKSYKYNYGSGYSYKLKYTIVGVRGSYHLTQLNVENLDLYGGLMLSYNIVSVSDNTGSSGSSYGSAAGFSAFVGGRYYFAKTLAVFAELGYGVSYLNLGLALKF